MEFETNKNTQNHKSATFSQKEIEAARQLIQLSNSIVDSTTTYLDEDHHSSNNSYSYSVQWKPQQSKDDTSAHASPSQTVSVEDVLAEIEEDERLRRRNKRYRYIQDLYNVTHPVVHQLPSRATNNKFI